MTTRHDTEHRSFEAPDETREFPHGRAEILTIGGAEVGRLVLEPGWRWSNDVKPIAGTESCEAPHFQYHVGGRLGTRIDDGTDLVVGARRHHLAAERPRPLGCARWARRGRRLVRRQQLRQARLAAHVEQRERPALVVE
jgi:hypothetical protein